MKKLDNSLFSNFKSEEIKSCESASVQGGLMKRTKYSSSTTGAKSKDNTDTCDGADIAIVGPCEAVFVG